MLLIVVPLLITNTQELQVEWSGVPHIGTHLTPLGVYIAVSKLDEVESILDIRLKILKCNMHARFGRVGVLELA